jgi:hypothetical protein
MWGDNSQMKRANVNGYAARRLNVTITAQRKDISKLHNAKLSQTGWEFIRSDRIILKMILMEQIVRA